ncbi:MAG TPA: CHRD domain-containing protein [Lacipirellulaceae bacterium]
MSNKLVVAALVATVTLMVACPAEAVTRFHAIIENEQEVADPPVPEQGSGGMGIFELNDAMNALSYDITLFGLDIDGLQTPNDPNDNAARFHIHAAPAGSNGGIVFGMKDPNHDLDDLVINPATSRITGVWDGTEGNGTTLAAQLANLLANGLYFNVHTPDHAGGEVRGQIILVPEPGTCALCAITCAALIGFARRRRVD